MTGKTTGQADEKFYCVVKLKHGNKCEQQKCTKNLRGQEL